MGKTIQIISLFVTDRVKPNLVVAYVIPLHNSSYIFAYHVFCGNYRPTVAIMQWRNEIAAHTDGMKVLVWHGSARESNVKELQKYDVVCTAKYLVLTPGSLIPNYERFLQHMPSSKAVSESNRVVSNAKVR
jgi:DNA repair protein RAD16